MKHSVFHIPRMDCPAEEELIRSRLERMAGVESLRFNLLARELKVAHALPSDRPLVAALIKLGMEPEVRGEAGVVRSVFHLPGMC